MTTKESDKEYAIKVLMLYAQKIMKKTIAVNRGDYTQKELKKIIKEIQPLV